MAKGRKGRGKASTKIKAAGKSHPQAANDSGGENAPSAQRKQHNEFHRLGIAHRMRPMLDSLAPKRENGKGGNGTLTQAEYEALAYYRDQASRAEDDWAQESTLAPSRVMGGGGGSFGSKIPVALMATPAMLETARIERDLGSLLPIARAIAVDDWSLSRWCIEQHGGRERYDGKGAFVAMVPVAEKRVMEFARVELRMAARRIVR